MYLIIWEYRARQGYEERFVEQYGPAGAWVKFFQRDKNYLGTELVRKIDDEREYLTMDRWQSQEAYQAFREQWFSEYQSIDRECATLTEHEAHIGSFGNI